MRNRRSHSNPATVQDNLRGAVYMALGMAGFTFNDACIKFVGTEVPLFQAIFVRGVFACCLIGFIAFRARAFHALPGRRDLTFVGIRSVAEVLATVYFLTALIHMPLANVTAILQSASLVVTLATAWLFKESVGPKRYIAILAGLIGVLIVVRPSGEGFNGYSLLAIATVFWITCRDLSARRLSAQVSSLFVTFVTAAIVTVAAGVAAAVTNQWISMSGKEIAVLALSACFLITGYYCMIAAMRVGDVSFVAPYRYTSMVWAIALGWLVFGSLPDFWTMTGICIIVGAGLFTLFRGRRSQI